MSHPQRINLLKTVPKQFIESGPTHFEVEIFQTFSFMKLNKYRKHVISDPTQPAAQAMLLAVSKKIVLK